MPKYLIRLEQGITAWGEIEVEAANEDDAQEKAWDRFEFSWENADIYHTDATVILVDGKPRKAVDDDHT